MGEDQADGAPKPAIHELPDIYGVRRGANETLGHYQARLFRVMKTTEATIADFEPAVERARLQVVEYEKRAKEAAQQIAEEPPEPTNVVKLHDKPEPPKPSVHAKPPFDPRILSSYQSSYDLLNAKLLEQRRKLALVTEAYTAASAEGG